MSKERWERLLSRYLDGELSPRQRARIESILAARPEYRERLEQWRSLGAQLRHPAPPGGPTPESAWAGVQRAIRLSKPEPAPTFGWRLGWTAASMATVLILGVGAWWRLQSGAGTVSASFEAPEVEWVDTDLDDAMTVVYRDAESGWTVIWVTAEPGKGDHAG